MPLNKSIEERVCDCITRALNLSSPSAIPLKMGSTPEWDSMGHMTVVLEIEKEFNVRFPAHRLPELTSIDAIVRAIEAERA